ncbi:glycosyltransferase family protein [Halopiger aswanensis]|uniref:Glycosyl transferase family 1 n=1 Tax=Halopiger aswanensis TaxID=148449 RepID=A0A419WRD0_9EURY|nr:glycosyltransferase [Halopiger aswanensis]RKD98053.1 glycosyl transferase family 1 [Halopiger aswanensis]
MEQNQVDKSSRYGLVLNWGLKRRGEWTVAEYPYFINQFIDRFDPIIITTQRLYERKAEELDNIFAFGARNNKGPTLDYLDEDHTVLLFASDPNTDPEWFYEYIHQNNVDRVLSPVYDPFFHWMPQLEEDRLEFFPWAVPSEFVLSPEEVQFRGNEEIHLTGASGSEVYKMRDWCRQQDYIIDYDNSGHQNRIFEHDEYYQWLRNFDCMVAAGSLDPEWQYLFGKYFEIPAAGALLFAQYSNDLARAGFTNDNCLIFNSKEEFASQAHQYLSDPESYLEKRRRGTRLIKENHTISHRIDTVDRLFRQN